MDKGMKVEIERRVIKFRFWHKRNKEFEYDNLDSKSRYQNPFMRSDLILCQFTGLLDRNGKEIYESDIIRELYQGKPKYSFPDNEVVEWGFHSDHSSYMFQLGWNLWEDTEYEIIGNIYENPELLKESK